MKLYTVVTPSHLKLFTEIFFPSVSSSFELAVIKQSIPGSGYFMEFSYLKSLEFRLLSILSSIQDNIHKVIVWSDVDILFNPLFNNDVAWSDFNNGHADLCFSRLGLNGPQPCFGFFMLRCTESSYKFWENVYVGVLNSPEKYDQIVGHDILLKGETPFAILPDSYHSNCFEHECPKDFKLFHATCVKGVDEKLKLLKEVRERLLPEKPS